MAFITSLTDCCVQNNMRPATTAVEEKKRDTIKTMAKGADLILGIALAIIALYGLFSGSIPPGTSMFLLGVGVVYFSVVLFNALLSVNQCQVSRCCNKNKPREIILVAPANPFDQQV